MGPTDRPPSSLRSDLGPAGRYGGNDLIQANAANTVDKSAGAIVACCGCRRLDVSWVLQRYLLPGY
jgi:hypothetical protein